MKSETILAVTGLAIAASAAAGQGCTAAEAFGAPVLLGSGANPVDLAVADFDGDGVPDLVVASRQSDEGSLLVSNGDGTFRPRVPIDQFCNGAAALAGDFDGDGNSDASVARYRSGAPSPCGANGLDVQFGDGGGGLSPVTRIFAGSSVRGGVAADFNGDGLDDIALLNGGSVDDSPVFLGRADRGFDFAGVFDGSYSARDIESGDIDGDGIVDLVTADDSGIAVLRGFGDASFSGRNFFARSQCRGLDIADINGDGNADVAVAVRDADQVSVFFGDGTGGFSSRADFGVGDAPYDVTAADINGDGFEDLVSANSGSNDISVLVGNGDGTFQPQARFASGARPRAITSGDFDNDGGLDVVVANESSNTVAVFFNQCTLPARITRQPASIVADAGSSAELTVEVGPGTRPLAFQWQRNGQPLNDGTGVGATVAGATTDTLVLTNITSAASDGYDVVVTNAAGETISIRAVLAVRDTCVVDVDNDGVLTVFDFLAFQNGFASGCP